MKIIHAIVDIVLFVAAAFFFMSLVDFNIAMSKKWKNIFKENNRDDI